MAIQILTNMSGFSRDGERPFSLSYGARVTRDDLTSWGVDADKLLDTLQARECDDSEVPEDQDFADKGPQPTAQPDETAAGPGADETTSNGSSAPETATLTTPETAVKKTTRKTRKNTRTTTKD